MCRSLIWHRIIARTLLRVTEPGSIAQCTESPLTNRARCAARTVTHWPSPTSITSRVWSPRKKLLTTLPLKFAAACDDQLHVLGPEHHFASQLQHSRPSGTLPPAKRKALPSAFPLMRFIVPMKSATKALAGAQ